jgi:IQ motif/SEC7 domain-containing protein
MLPADSNTTSPDGHQTKSDEVPTSEFTFCTPEDHDDHPHIDQFIDVDNVLMSGSGATITDAANTFHQLSLTDSSYGDIIVPTCNTDDELDDDDDVATDDEYAQPIPLAPAHVYSSLRLCNRHGQMATASSQPAVSTSSAGFSQQLPASSSNVVRLATGVSAKQLGSPIWKRKDRSGLDVAGLSCGLQSYADSGSIEDACHSGSEDTASNGSGSVPLNCQQTCTYSRCAPPAAYSCGSKSGSADNLLECPPLRTCQHGLPRTSRGSDKQRKRTYRIGLNLFNKKPEKGIRYLVEHRFLDNRPNAVARFLITRKGLSKLMIGEYLGNLQKQFNAQVLVCFSAEIDLTGLQVDVALRKFQSYFRMPGEAQKIERLMEAFASQYCQCNVELVKQFRRPDTVFLLAFATIMLNTDLHNKSIKAERKMKLVDFIRNLRGIDDGKDVDPELLTGIYERVQACEFQPSADHVLQVLKVEQMIVGKKPQLALLHRRLVCYCRLYEVTDMNRKEKVGQHQREVFLFNDMIMVTKIVGKRKNSVTYTFRCSFPLYGVAVEPFSTSSYKYGLRLVNCANGKVLLMLNARNEHDRDRFVSDLKEAILEVNEMERLRVEEELGKQTIQPRLGNVNRYSKDSGVVDIELLKPLDFSGSGGQHQLHDEEQQPQLSGSLAESGEADHSCSAGSVDSGMVSLHC